MQFIYTKKPHKCGALLRQYYSPVVLNVYILRYIKLLGHSSIGTTEQQYAPLLTVEV